MTMKYLVSLLLLLTSCAGLEAILSPTPTPSPKPDLQTSIKGIIAMSDCAKFVFGNRGKPNATYLQYIAEGYHKAFCGKESPLPLGTKTADALALYELAPTVRNTYQLLLGLGMQESSGKSCTGKDASADNTTATEAEAGLFQSSFNSMIFAKVVNGKTTYVEDLRLRTIFNSYKGCATAPCVGKEAEVYGKGEGATFQKQSKECPAFAVEYNALAIRLKRGHFGPLNRKEAKVVPACGAMLDQVSALGC